jgi:AcrR family transcriptional regulator
MNAKRVGILRVIKSVALDLFIEDGYDRTRVEDIAAATGISRRSFFRYFKSKEDIVFSWTDDEALMAWPLLLECAAREEPLNALRRAFLKLAARDAPDLEHVRRLMSVIFSTPSLRGRLHEEASRWQTKLSEAFQALHRQDPDTLLRIRVRNAAAVAAYLTAVEEWISPGNARSLVTLVVTAFDALNDSGVRGEPDGYPLRIESDHAAAPGTAFHRWSLDRAVLRATPHTSEPDDGTADHHGRRRS